MVELQNSSPNIVQALLSALPYLIAALVALLLGFLGLVWLDIFTHPQVRAWRNLAGMRGYAGPVGTIERLAARSAFIARIQKTLDLPRLLPIANVNLSPLGFIGQSSIFALIVVLGFFAIEILGLILNQGWLLPPGLGIVFAFAVYAWQLVMLRGRASRNQYIAGKTLSDMMMMVAIMTDGRGLQVEDAVRILSSCSDSDVLQTIVDNKGYARLIKSAHKSTAELYMQIGEQFEVPMFTSLAEAMLNTNVGMQERNTFTNLAKISYQHRLTEARLKASRAKILVTIPVAGMLIPLLILIGFPAFQSITSGITGH